MSGELQTNKEKWVPASYDDPERFIVDAQGVKAKFVLWVSAYECQCRFDFICSPIHVVSHTRDSDTGVYGKLLQIVDDEGKIEEWVMPASALFEKKGEVVLSKLASLGVHIPQMSLAPLVLEYLSWSKPSDKTTCASKPGWLDGIYVMPGQIIGDTGDRKIVLKDSHKQYPFASKGSLDDWNNNIGKYCQGNGLLMLGVSTAFAALLVGPAGKEPLGFHLYGKSSSGKTTILEVAGGITGGPRNVHPWKLTENGAEALAALHNDTLLCMDELGMSDPNHLGASIHTVHDGIGKMRANRNGDARRAAKYRTSVLSTGELTLKNKMSEGGKQRSPTAGQSVRLVELQADICRFGCYDDIHQFSDGAEMSNHFKKSIREFYGTPAVAFLESVVGNVEDVLGRIKVIEEAFMRELITGSADGQVIRVAEKFAFVAAVGEIAIENGIIQVSKGAALEGLMQCAKEWIAKRGGTTAMEGMKAKEALLEFIGLNRGKTICHWKIPNQEFNQPNRKYFGHYIDNMDNNSTDYFITTAAFSTEICKPLNATEDVVINLLDAEGLFIKGEKNRIMTRKKFKGGRLTYYVFKVPGDL